jgi:hypothetical protein
MLETVASDVVDSYGNDYQINLVLDDRVKSNPASAVQGLLFWRYADEPGSEFQPMGAATIGTEFTFPFEFPDGREIELSVVARTATGEQSAVDPRNGVFYRFTPNRESGTASFSQDGAALNLLINFIATGYSVAKFRKIQWDTVNTFDSVNLTEKIEGSLTGTLSANFNITRPGPAAAVLAVYVRIAHSTNSSSFGSWSATRSATFADNTNSGGSSGGTPPSGLNYYLSGGTVYLSWTDGAGTNDLYRNGVLHEAAVSGSTTDTLTDPGYYSYTVQNADGSSNEISFYYSG